MLSTSDNNKFNMSGTLITNKKAPKARSHKKKNTYVVKLNNMFFNFTLFQLCNDTPMPVVILNGREIQQNNSWLSGTKFPNPNTYNMIAEYPQLEPTMGKLSCTIVEYLDKDNGRPVLKLFPSTIYIHNGYEKDYMTHLNHASRRDLEYQIQLRARLIDKALQNKR